MRRFFVAPEAVQGESVLFDAELAHHMGKVLRLTAGEQVTVCTGDGRAYLVELSQFSKDSVTGTIVEQLDHQQETEVQIVLYQGMPKGDKLELIIQKCTESGRQQSGQKAGPLAEDCAGSQPAVQTGAGAGSGPLSELETVCTAAAAGRWPDHHLLGG